MELLRTHAQVPGSTATAPLHDLMCSMSLTPTFICHVRRVGAGGTHHAFAGRGEGFCAFNDIAVGAAAAMAEHGVDRILVIDLDVHQAR